MREAGPPWLLAMHWRDVAFAHWRADASRLAHVLPPGVELDRFDGDAWLSVVPFRLSRVRLRGTPVLPGFADVPELNLRTYVRVGERRGIWFFSLDAASPLAVRSARVLTSLPYFDARMTTSERAGVISYASERTHRATAGGVFRATYHAPANESAYTDGSLQAFLHDRYAFFTRRGGTLVTGVVRHAPWTLAPTTFTIERNTLGDLIGHPLHGAPEHAFFARSLAVRATAVRRVSAS